MSIRGLFTRLRAAENAVRQGGARFETFFVPNDAHYPNSPTGYTEGEVRAALEENRPPRPCKEYVAALNDPLVTVLQVPFSPECFRELEVLADAARPASEPESRGDG